MKRKFRLKFSCSHPALGDETVRYDASGTLNNFEGSWEVFRHLFEQIRKDVSKSVEKEAEKDPNAERKDDKNHAAQTGM